MGNRQPTFQQFQAVAGADVIVGLSLIETDSNNDIVTIENGSLFDASGVVTSGAPLPGTVEFYIAANRTQVHIFNAGAGRSVLLTTIHKGASR